MVVDLALCHVPLILEIYFVHIDVCTTILFVKFILYTVHSSLLKIYYSTGVRVVFFQRKNIGGTMLPGCITVYTHVHMCTHT